jgi:hypothetical protein
MPNFPISRVYEAKQSLAHMLRPDTGQIDFLANGESFSFLIPRADFARLGRKIFAVLGETPPPVRRRVSKHPSSGK